MIRLVPLFMDGGYGYGFSWTVSTTFHCFSLLSIDGASESNWNRSRNSIILEMFNICMH
jgi:hypothetical protein